MRSEVLPARAGGGAKQQVLVARIRREIIRGRLAAGATLPSRLELCKRWKTTPVTLQKVVRQLAADGYLITEPGRATRVAAYPPHWHRYGVVFRGGHARPCEPDLRAGWTMFDAALYRAVQEVERAAPGRQFRCYFQVDGHADGDDLQQLWCDLARGRLAGLIFVDPPYWLGTWPDTSTLTVPMVGLFDHPCGVGIRAVAGDRRRWWQQASQWLKARRRRRLAVFHGVPGPGCRQDPNWHEQIDGLRRDWPRLPEHWVFPIHYLSPETAVPILQVLLSLPAGERPDALIVSDEHLAEQVGLGLRAAGARVGQDLDVVAHCSFPCAVKSPVPLTWLGFDIPGVLQACLRIVGDCHAGRQPPVLDSWRPVWAAEFVRLAAGRSQGWRGAPPQVPDEAESASRDGRRPNVVGSGQIARN